MKNDTPPEGTTTIHTDNLGKVSYYKEIFILSLLGGAALLSVSCTPTQRGAGFGAGLGAGAGALIGSRNGNAGRGALIGAGIGGLGGALVGDANDDRGRPSYNNYDRNNYNRRSNRDTRGPGLNYNYDRNNYNRDNYNRNNYNRPSYYNY
tara:strand:- start:4383 stop:4832 length:450 start_codon:yes stop_codon:yes gene_type:complete